MKHELELKVQAWLDGELSERESARIGEWIVQDAEAAELAANLGQVKKVIAANETAVTVPESRDFYWSKIRRQIQAEERAAAPAVSPGWAWRRWLMPIAGVATIVCAFLIAREEMRPPTFDEISASDEGMEAVTFHDQSAGMTVVWLQDGSESAPPPAAAAAPKATEPVNIPDPGESEVVE